MPAASVVRDWASDTVRDRGAFWMPAIGVAISGSSPVRTMATHGTPLNTCSLYRPSSGASGATPIAVAVHYQPKAFAAGAVQNGAERSRLLELLRAPNNLTSPTLEPSSKGLLNGPGQNNCFLNCAVQVSQATKLFREIWLWCNMALPRIISKEDLIDSPQPIDRVKRS